MDDGVVLDAVRRQTRFEVLSDLANQSLRWMDFIDCL